MDARAQRIVFSAAAALAVVGMAGIGMLGGKPTQPIHRFAASGAALTVASTDAARRVPAPTVSQRLYAMPFYSFAGRLPAAGRG